MIMPIKIREWLDEQYDVARAKFDSLSEPDMIEAIRSHMAKCYAEAAGGMPKTAGQE